MISKSTNIQSPIITSNGFRVTFDKGSSNRRLITLTDSSLEDDIRFPTNGVEYQGHLKFGRGDKLSSTEIGTHSCYPYENNYPLPSQEPPVTITGPKTFVMYEGMNDGTMGIDIINLRPKKTYQLVIYENNNYCYVPSDILTITTSFDTNTERFEIVVYDNRTKNPIQNASISIKNSRGFISDFGKSDVNGKYNSIDMEEGRYEMSILSNEHESKILTGLFVQRKEPRRDSHYRIFTTAGNTEIGSSVDRDQFRNRNKYTIHLDPLDSNVSSFNKYQASPNPSKLTKL